MPRTGYEQIVTNIGGPKKRYDTLHGIKYLIVDAVMMTEGVHSGSEGPIFYPGKQLNKAVPAWNHKPITYDHPPDKLSASDLTVMRKQSLGFVLNSEYDDPKQKAEAWLDIGRTRKIAPDIIKKLENNEKVEVSTGLFLDYVEKSGKFGDEKYKIVAENHRPDHLAILMNGKGACSIEKGAGLLTNKYCPVRKQAKLAYNRYYSSSERKSMPKSQFGDPARRAFPVRDQSDLTNAARLIRHAKNPDVVKARLKHIARKMKLTLPKSWQEGAVKNKLVINGMSYSRISRHLEKALRKKHSKDGDYWGGYIEDVYPDHVIYSKYQSGDRKTYKQGYKVGSLPSADPVNLVGDPEEVYPHQEWRTSADNNLVGNSRNGAKTVGTFNRKRHIKLLINNGIFTRDDRAELDTLTDTVLKRIRIPQLRSVQNSSSVLKEIHDAVTTKKKKKTADVTPVVPVVNTDLESSLKEIRNPEMREMLKRMIQNEANEKAEMIKKLMTTNVFQEPYLKERSLEELKGMIKLSEINKAKPTNNERPASRVLFTGANTPGPTTNESTEGDQVQTKNKLVMPKLYDDEAVKSDNERKRSLKRRA